MGHPISFEISNRREGDPAQLLADASLAREELNWQPIYPALQTIIEHAWNARVNRL
jgi:UDP-glucose 4-epimerase